jgi:hypothetical protein
VYVTGSSFASGGPWNSDYATLKYDADGNQLWVARYNGPASGLDEARALALDGTGNVYVTGSSSVSGTGFNTDYATVKYDPDGNQLWVRRYNGPGNNFDSARALALDGAGDVYVTGQSTGLGTSSDFATVKYDADGNQVWVARYNGPSNGPDYATALAIDSAGNVYVAGGTGRYGEPDVIYDYATIKYDAEGNQLWVAGYHWLDDSASALAVDTAGNVYVTGRSGGLPLHGGFGPARRFGDYATIKYDPDGNQLWVRRYNGLSSDEDVATALAVDGAGNVYVTGMSLSRIYYDKGEHYDYDYATVKYDPDGNALWIAHYNEPGYGEDRANAITIDAAGNVYVTGGSQGDYATIKYLAAPSAPAAPGDLSAAAISPSQIDLSWTDNSEGESGFAIERWNGALGEYEEIATVEADVTSFSDAGLAAETTYSYRVRAFNAAGHSDYSNEAEASTPPE